MLDGEEDRILGVIPARGGSKGIPNKNLAPLAGKPLLAYTIEAAQQSSLDRCIVSTDDDLIARTARDLGAEVPFMRPAELSTDDSPMVDVLTHCAAELPEAQVFVLLQPTSPLRTTQDIDGSIDLLERSGADSVVSVVRVPHRFTPSSLLLMDGDRLEPLEGAEGPTDRHGKPVLYARNGPAVLVVRRSVIEKGRLYGADTRGFVMPEHRSVDIDEPHDLRLAESFLTWPGRPSDVPH